MPLEWTSCPLASQPIDLVALTEFLMGGDNMPFNEILRLSGFWTWIVVLSILAGCGSMNVGGGANAGATGLGHCAAAARLVPDFTVHNPTGPGYREYNTNATQYNAICLPETWH